MKLSSHTSAGALTLLLFPALAHAQGIDLYIVTFTRFLNDIVVPVLFSLAFLFFLINLTRYFIIEGTSDESRGKAKRNAIWGIAAFVLLFSLWTITSLLLQSLAISQTDPDCPDYVKQFQGGCDVTNQGSIDDNSFFGSFFPGSSNTTNSGTSVTNNSTNSGSSNNTTNATSQGNTSSGSAASTCLSNHTNGDHSVVVYDETRTYNFYKPSSLPSNGRVPVLLVFHGTGGSRDGIRSTTNFNTYAQTHQFAVAYPESQFVDTTKKWDLTGQHAADLAFVGTLMSELEQQCPQGIDWYVAGMSNGAVFGQSVACSYQKVRGLGSVSGSLGTNALAQCQRTIGIKHIGFYGTADAELTKFESTMNFFAQKNTCDVVETREVGVDDATYDYSASAHPCTDHNRYYRIVDGGHFWPGATYSSLTVQKRPGDVAENLNASQAIAEFLIGS